MAATAGALVPAVEGATGEQLQQLVDFGPVQLPLWQVLGACLLEGMVHSWDMRARRKPETTIPAAWARELAGVLIPSIPMLAHADAEAGRAGRSLFEVDDGVGSVTVVTEGGTIQAQPGRVGSPDVTVHLTADRCVRLLPGLLPLGRPIEGGEVTVEGDPVRAAELNRIFAGVGH